MLDWLQDIISDIDERVLFWSVLLWLFCMIVLWIMMPKMDTDNLISMTSKIIITVVSLPVFVFITNIIANK